MGEWGTADFLPGWAALAWAAKGFVLGLSAVGLLFWLQRRLGWVTLEPDAAWEAPPQLRPLLRPMPMFLVVGAEEVLFRWLILGRWLLPAAGPWTAILLSSLLFGAAHVFNERPYRIRLSAVNAALIGVFLGVAYIVSGSLAHVIAWHFAWNYAQWSLLGYPLYGSTVVGRWGATVARDGIPPLASGGKSGLEGSLLATATAVALTLIYLPRML